jgi:hypothetical protein
VAAFAQLLLDLYAASHGATAQGRTPRSRGLEVSDDVERVFIHALSAPPEERFATVGDLWSALRGALHLPMLRSLTATLPPEERASIETRYDQRLQIRDLVAGHDLSIGPSAVRTEGERGHHTGRRTPCAR